MLLSLRFDVNFSFNSLYIIQKNSYSVWTVISTSGTFIFRIYIERLTNNATCTYLYIANKCYFISNVIGADFKHDNIVLNINILNCENLAYSQYSPSVNARAGFWQQTQTDAFESISNASGDSSAFPTPHKKNEYVRQQVDPLNGKQEWNDKSSPGFATSPGNTITKISCRASDDMAARWKTGWIIYRNETSRVYWPY